MNFAKIIELGGAPALVIYAEPDRTGRHADILGATNLKTGACTAVRFDGEGMPKPGRETTTWLIMKTQEVLRTRIKAVPWDETRIHIRSVVETPALVGAAS